MSSILITGGSGFFGQHFTRHLLNNYPQFDRICIYSRSEHVQAAMRDSFSDDEQKRLRFFVGDVRDKERLTRAMRGCTYVVHAAALKRIEVGNYAPDEIIKTNILGTMNAIDAAAYNGVSRFVFISSDKAWQPISPYGQSKALGESLVLNANNMFGTFGPKFTAIRYGNVWGSTGSIVPKWKKLIADGAIEVPVSDPECTRFYLSINEAVREVALMLFGVCTHDLLILDHLPAYRLGDLAEAMGAKHLKITGLPKWEKIHEGMGDGITSDVARRMTVEELKTLLGQTK